MPAWPLVSWSAPRTARHPRPAHPVWRYLPPAVAGGTPWEADASPPGRTRWRRAI